MDGERYSGLVALSQIKKVCKAFNSTKTLKEALVILHNTIEGGNIFLTEDREERCIELKFAVKLASGEFPPFSIFLELEGGNSLKESKRPTPQPKKGHKGKGGNKKGQKNEAILKNVPPQANPNIVDSSKYSFQTAPVTNTINSTNIIDNNSIINSNANYNAYNFNSSQYTTYSVPSTYSNQNYITSDSYN